MEKNGDDGERDVLVQLNIRSQAPGRGETDDQVEARLGWSVLRLKEEIRDSLGRDAGTSDGNRLTIKIPVEDQKLIYGGKVLQNDSALKDIIMSDGKVNKHTIQLISPLLLSLRSRASKPAQKKASGTVWPPELANPVSEVLSGTGSSAQVPVSAAATTAAHALPSYTEQQASEMWQSYFRSLYGAADPSQLDHFHQVYAHSMAHYMNLYYLQQAYHNNGSFPTNDGALENIWYRQYLAMMASQLPSASAPSTADVQPQPDAGRDFIPEGNRGQAPPVIDPDAEARAENNEFGGPRRDVIDWVYILVRLGLLFTFIFMHSSFYRFAFVAGVGILVYLHRVNLARNRAEAFATAAAETADAILEGGNQNAGEAGAEGATDETEGQRQREQGQADERLEDADVGVRQQEAGQELRQRRRPRAALPAEAAAIPVNRSWYELVFVFVTNFFTSMLPDDPHQLMQM